MSASGEPPWISASFLFSCCLTAFSDSSLSLKLQSSRLPCVADCAWFSELTPTSKSLRHFKTLFIGDNKWVIILKGDLTVADTSYGTLSIALHHATPQAHSISPCCGCRGAAFTSTIPGTWAAVSHAPLPEASAEGLGPLLPGCPLLPG